ncbi:MAG: CPBP family intramembrane glutamic endopeptidase [Nocardioides sp.]
MGHQRARAQRPARRRRAGPRPTHRPGPRPAVLTSIRARRSAQNLHTSPFVTTCSPNVRGVTSDGDGDRPRRAPGPTLPSSALVPALFIGPIEELGWRGVAMPLLQRRFAPLWAALIVGVVAALWHTQMNGPAWLTRSRGTCWA